MTLLDMFLPYQRTFFLNPARRKVWVSARQIGKSFCVAGMLVYKALSKQNGLSLCVSVNSRSASEIIRKCSQFAEAVKQLSNGHIDYESAYDHINFSNGSRVLSLPSTSDGLRGWSGNCVCLDEAAFIYKLDEILQGIAPTLTRDPNSELILTTTPAGMNGDFYELYQKAIHNPEWYVQHTTIHDAISDGLDVDISRLKTLCPDPDIFAQEYECQFLSEYGSMIDVNLLDWYDDELPTGRQTTYLGMDIGSSNDRSAIVTAIQISDITYIDDIILLNNTSYQEQLTILKQIHKLRNFASGYVDRNGIGSAFAEFATKQVSSRIQGWNFTSQNKPPMYERLRSMVYDHKVKFNSKLRKMIEADFRNVQRIITPDGNVKYTAKHDQNGHSDATSGIVLALQAASDRPASLSSPIPYSIQSRF